MSLFLRRPTAITTLILSVLFLSSCMIYRTRIFKQVDTFKFESWHVNASARAFNKSSGANPDNHTFSVVGNITRYPENADTLYKPNAKNLKMFSGQCPGMEEFDMPPLKVKNFGKSQHGRVYIRSEEQVLIDPNIKYICVHIEAEFTSLAGGETQSKTYEINMKRYERSVPGPAMD